MGKKSRVVKRRIKVDDAAQLIAYAEAWELPDDLNMPTGTRHAAGMARLMLQEWRKSSVVLRVDLEFAGALLDSDMSVEMVPDWMDRLPFDSVAVSFPEPISLHDGQETCRYAGFIATGIRSGAMFGGKAFTRYGSLGWGDGIRFLWFFTTEADPVQSRPQTVTVNLRGQYAKSRTLAELVSERKHGLRAVEEVHADSNGAELEALVPIAVQLMLYLSATNPDVDQLPPNQIARPAQLRTAEVINVGWRIGAALRSWRTTSGSARAVDPRRVTGWRLPPHIRRAHWHRVRVATRGPDGSVVGSRTGEQGVDWAYEIRWYPPAPVNVDDAHPVDPVVRRP
jgi:hypothetical protein